MLRKLFHSQGVQPAWTLQTSYHTAQGSGTETGFTAAGCVCARRGSLRERVGAHMCECLFVLIFAVYFCTYVHMCECV